MSTYKELLQTAREFLKRHEIADADLDAWYLLSHVYGMNRAGFLLHGEEEACEKGRKQYENLIKKRAQHIPLQYLTGTQEFMGLEFRVTEDVLIPRQDTEVLVEDVLRVCEGKSVLDLCTGSGCIIISIAKLSRLKKAVGTDLSEKALKVAALNALKHNTAVEWIQGDLFEKVDGEYDIIVSNPPYIPTDEIKELMPEVREYEPVTALDGSTDGLLFYRRIAADVKKHLSKQGFLFFEIGCDQGEAVKQLLQNEGFTDISITKDLSGLDRVVSGKRS